MYCSVNNGYKVNKMIQGYPHDKNLDLLKKNLMDMSNQHDLINELNIIHIMNFKCNNSDFLSISIAN